MDPKTRSSYIRLAVIIIMAIAVLFLRNRNHESQNSSTRQKIDNREKGFRHHHVYYTKHAKCRMDCRHIDESEVNEILDSGTINYSKSETAADPCPKYALEGITHDKQHMRIIVGDCKTEASIITVIDLDNDFECDCK